jgi:hypothetical protein
MNLSVPQTIFLTFLLPQAIFYDFVSTPDTIVSIKGRQGSNEMERILMKLVWPNRIIDSEFAGKIEENHDNRIQNSYCSCRDSKQVFFRIRDYSIAATLTCSVTPSN